MDSRFLVYDVDTCVLRFSNSPILVLIFSTVIYLPYKACVHLKYSCAQSNHTFILQRNAFSHPGRAIVKVMTMTTGELDYDDLFHQQEGEEEIAFPPVSFILWIMFLVLIPILLNNLLVSC